MKSIKESCLLYAVLSDENPSVESVQQAIAGGITMLQVRCKNSDHQKRVEVLKKIVPICHEAGIYCIVDDDVQAVLETDADGVHLGQSDMSPVAAREILGADAILGVSAHNLQEAQSAEANGANYLGCGAVFPTGTKQDTTPLSKETLLEISNGVNIPIVAIGGIQRKNICRLQGTGIDGVAVVSAIFSAENITTATEQLLQVVKEIIQ